MLLVFGSLNVDMLFKVDALPRPGETVLCPSYELAPGGKGANQAAAAAKAGAEVRMVGHLGADSFGGFARGEMAKAGVDCANIATSNQATATAVIGVDAAGENQIIVASGANLDTRADQVGDDDLSAEVTLLCQNEIDPEATFAVLERGKQRGARTILNLAPAGAVPTHVLDALDFLVVNEIEAAMAAGTGESADATELARALATRHDLTAVVTLGGRGAIALSPTDAFEIGALPVTPRDTTGAGDAFTGVLAAALDEQRTLPEALQRASVAAGLACTQIGAQTSQPQAAEIEANLSKLPPARSI